MLETIFFFSIPYLEIVLSLFTAKSAEWLSYICMLLLAIMTTLLGITILKLIRSTRLRHIISCLILAFCSVLYYAMFLLYRSFQVFYDINTCLNGAGGAFRNFMSDILRLILDARGILVLCLMLLPTFLYIIFCLPIFNKSHKIHIRPLSIKSSFFTSMMIYLIALWIILTNTPLRSMYAEVYSYQPVVENFGLSTGLRLDLKHLFMDKLYLSSLYDEIARGIEPLTIDSDELPSDDNLSEETTVLEANLDESPYTSAGIVDTVDLFSEANELASLAGKSTDKEDSDSSEEIPEEKVYLPNAYDLDYIAMAENASKVNSKLDNYVASLEPSLQNEYTGLFEGKNLIFITAEAFSGYVINEELTPTLYRLSTKGIQFTDYYQPAIAGTTGGEYANIFGLIPANGGKSMSVMTKETPFLSLGFRFSALGYYGKAFHDNDGYVYDRNTTHNLLGYSDGFMGVGNGMEEYLTTRGFPASDCEMMQGTLPTYIDKQPFNIYYMSVSGHGQYGRSINQMSSRNYERVQDLPYSEMVKCYIANNLALEDALTYLVDELEKKGIADDTVIVVGADHFPYGLDKNASIGNMPNLSELYGENVNNYLMRDQNRLIIWSGCIEKMDPIIVDSPTFSLDILPTLSNLFGLDYDSRLLPGRDVFSDAEAIIFDGGYDWKTDLGTYLSSKGKFIPASEDIEIPEDYVSRISAIVAKKYSFCKEVVQDDYYGHVYEALNAAQ